MPHFTELVDLASESVGGIVLHANDDFFAPKESLLKPEPAVFIADRYTDRGKWMDGWESRRRRTPGHDYCFVKLGLRGVIRGVDVDTSHFKGNYPEACSLYAAFTPDGSLEPFGTGEAAWHEILPKTALRGDARNLFPVFDGRLFTHVRLHIYPDGGVARLRVHGDAVADWVRLQSQQELVDFAALGNGGLVLAASDSFFGSYQKLLMPHAPSGMHDGWETRRSRRHGYDWAIVRLGTRGLIEGVEVDTSHFKGNFPDLCAIDACDAPGASLESLTDAGREWATLLPETKLYAHNRHTFGAELAPAAPATHVRLRIYPDGGVGRLRLFGRPAPPAAVLQLDAAGRDDALALLLRCCGSYVWASRVEAMRPFASHLELLSGAERAFDTLDRAAWLEAFRAHPRIGDLQSLHERFGSTREWAEGEQQAAVTAGERVLEELMELNRAYEDRFGHIFIVCATGLTALQMASSLRERLGNPPDVELAFAAEEQRRITRLRLAKMLSK